MRITTQLTITIITLVIFGTAISAQKKPKLPPTPLQQTLTSKTYQRELQTAQREQAQLTWQIGVLPPIDANFFTHFFSETQQYLEDRRWVAQQRPLPISLQNLGYTCSFNALTQVLWRLTPFNLALIRSTVKPTPLIKEYLASIATKNTTKKEIISVKDLIDILNTIKGKQLADPFEIWQLFTEQCPGDVKELFNVATNDTVYCHIEGHDKASQIVPYPYVSIRIISKQAHNLQDMLNRQIQEETIEEVSAKCTNKDKDKKLCNQLKLKASKVLAQSPAILVIHTGRSTGERHDNKTPLVQDAVTFPLNNLIFGKQSYDLFGVVFHQGIYAEGGHYYSWTRQQNGSWYYCSDTDIRKINNLEKIQQAHRETFVFFYLRRRE